jgi:hypothetical protein
MTNDELRELLVSKVQQLPDDRLPDLAEWLRALECGEGTERSLVSAAFQNARNFVRC